MVSDLLARTRHWSALTLSLVAAGVFTVVVGLGYAWISRIPAPDYGTWTGIRPLETKLRALEHFAAAGPIDALVLGSSITEFGFSAKLFSELMTQKLGREYRAYNFATGGAEPRTLPKLYRLARTVSRPRTVFVMVPAEQKLVNKIYEGSPDLTLQNAPVGGVLQHPFLLEFNRMVWSTPILRNAPALRDKWVFGIYKNLAQAVGMESYALSTHGDRVSYLVTWKSQDLPTIKLSAEFSVTPFVPKRAPADEQEELDLRLEKYFAQLDIDAMEELKTLVKKDGGKIVLVSHGAAATLWGGTTEDQQYAKGRLDFFATMARKLEAPFWDPIAITRVPLHGVSDVTHLNAHGAEIYTRVLAAVATGAVDKATADSLATEMATPPVETMFPTQDKTFNLLSALVRRPPGQVHPLFKFRAVTSLAVPALPTGDLHVAFRLPDNRDIVTRAIPVGTADFVAEVNLPAAARPEGILVRILQGDGPHKVALNNPLEDYEWLQSWPRTPLAEPPPVADLQVLALPPLRSPGQVLYFAMRAKHALPANPSVRLVPTAGAAIDLGPAVAASGQLLKVMLPDSLALGSYGVEVVAAGKTVARAPALRVEDPEPTYVPATLQIVGKPTITEGVKLVWKGIRKPSSQEWIGLFPVNGRVDTAIDKINTRSQSDGEAIFTIASVLAPRVASGELEFRLYSGATLLASTPPFSLGGPARTDPAPMAGVPGTPGTKVAAASHGAPSAATDPTITSEPKPILAAGRVKVSWSGIRQPAEDDWIGIFPAKGRPEDRMDFVFTKGKAAGEVLFPTSGIAHKLGKGEHEFRLYARGGWTLLATGAPFRFDSGASATVEAAPGPATSPVAAATASGPSVASPPPPVAASRAGGVRISSETQPAVTSASVKVRWSGIPKPSHQDWIGLFPAGGKPEERLDFVFIQGKAEGEIAFPISSAIAAKLTSGQYEFRIYSGWTQLSQSDRIKFIQAR